MGLLNLIPGVSVAKYAALGVVGAGLIGGAGLLYYRWTSMQGQIVSLKAANVGLQRDVAQIAGDNASLSAGLAAAKAQSTLDAGVLATLSASQSASSAVTGGALATIKAAPSASANAPVPPLVWQTIQSVAP